MDRHFIAEAASYLREDLHISPADTVQDLVSIIKENGYHYCEDHFGSDFCGFSQYIGAGTYLIGYNLDQDFGNGFKRFTLAHELAHVTLPHHREILTGSDSLHRSTVTHYVRNTDLEREADYFAASFLVPEKLFQPFLHDSLSERLIFEASSYFDVSLHVAAMRFIDLTDLPCTLIVSCKGIIEYERRSSAFRRLVSAQYLTRNSLTGYNHLPMAENGVLCSLNAWYPDVCGLIWAEQFTIETSFKTFTFLTVKDIQSV